MAGRSRGPLILRRHRCVLVCGWCGCDIATAETGPSGRVRVVHVSGVDVAPMQGVVGRSPAEDLEAADKLSVAFG
jgi:hypothetical protein